MSIVSMIYFPEYSQNLCQFIFAFLAVFVQDAM